MPNLQSLASEGVILNKSYGQPICSPSRAAYLTAFYPFRIGLQNSAIRNGVADYLPLNLTLLPQRLRELNYSTHLIGKWHLGHCRVDATPTYRGFDSFFGLYSSANDYYTKMTLPGATFALGRPPAYDLRLNLDVYNSSEEEYETDLFTQRAVNLIANHSTEIPLYISLQYTAPHVPLKVPDRFLDFYPNVTDENRRKYLAIVTSMDEGIGQVVQALKDKGMFDNTIIVFQSDNGGKEGTGGASNDPLRGEKKMLYEGGTRLPAMIYSKNLISNPGRVYEGLFHLVDWFPTLLSAVGVKDSGRGMDGVDQWPVLKTESGLDPRKVFIYNINGGDGALRFGRYKLTEGNPGGFLGRRRKRSVDGNMDTALDLETEDTARTLQNTDRAAQLDSERSRTKRSSQNETEELEDILASLNNTDLEMDLRKLFQTLNNVDLGVELDSAGGRKANMSAIDTEGIVAVLEKFGPNNVSTSSVCATCELYDLQADPVEAHDMAADYQLLVQFLYHIYSRFKTQEVDPVLKEPPVIIPQSNSSLYFNNTIGTGWCGGPPLPST
ncbi:arylsulfatase J-like [Littorina saxatilis]